MDESEHFTTPLAFLGNSLGDIPSSATLAAYAHWWVGNRRAGYFGDRGPGRPRGVRGLALFLLPRLKENGELNYTIRRVKDKIGTRSVPTGEIELRNSEAWLLGGCPRTENLLRKSHFGQISR